MMVSENLKKKYKEAVEDCDLSVYEGLLDHYMIDKEIADRIRAHAEKAAETMGKLDEEAMKLSEVDDETVGRFVLDDPSKISVGDGSMIEELKRAILNYPPENVMKHAEICMELINLYEKKNRDYGDSFHKTYLEEGMAMARIRLTDKLERFKKLTREGGQAVKDESVRDTLIDMANYCIMTAMEMDREAEENGCG